MLPAAVADFQNQLKSALQTNTDLVAILASKIAENDELRKENHQLRQLAGNKPKKISASDQHLIITDASLQGVKSGQDDIEVRFESDLTFARCRTILSQKTKNSYKSITVVAGRTDCSGNTPVETITKELEPLLHEAKTLADSVQISSVLPQKLSSTTQERTEQMNSACEIACNSLQVAFVNNDPSFRLGDGEIFDGFLLDDGYSPNLLGQQKLVKNLGLSGKVMITSENDWVKEPGVKPKPKSKPKAKQNPEPQSRAPCFNCGLSNHTSNICNFRKRVTCHRCGKVGHKASVCGH